MNNKIENVIIAGGGTAGWMAAAALTKLLPKNINVTLIESDEISTVGVGEATIPPIRTFHKLLQIDEQAFLKATNGTFKLGIEFNDWGLQQQSYFHSFGSTGKECWAGEFHHFWLKSKELGKQYEFGDFCLELKAAQQNKFGFIKESPVNFAYHFDASLYAKFLRQYSESLGLTRIEGKINKVNKALDGSIISLDLIDGSSLSGDLFIDCTGFRGVLIEQALHTGYEDWSHYLPCDSAVAMQTKRTDSPLIPYTKSTAHSSGWQWRIPLQNRIGNGLVYCSKYQKDEDALALLEDNIEGEPLTKPNFIKFRPGRRLKGWNKNCVAFGLASGFIEPLESTSIHLIMTGVIRLARLFPFNGISEYAVDEYNNKLKSELENIRDFIILHYKVTEREDSDFWRHCKNLDIPKSLQHKIELFKQTGRVFLDDGDLFRVDSWTQVMLGQGIVPEQYHQIASIMTEQELETFLNGLKQNVLRQVSLLPDHQEFVSRYCPSKE